MNLEYCVSGKRTISLTHSNSLPNHGRLMLKARRNPGTELRADFTYRVTNSGIEIATINEARLTFDLGGRNFSVHRRGILGPEFARSFIAE
jgi:hypothetical protein